MREGPLFICTRYSANTERALVAWTVRMFCVCRTLFAKYTRAESVSKMLWRGATMSFKVMAICAGRHGGNGEALAKEALCAVREAGGEVELINLFD